MNKYIAKRSAQSYLGVNTVSMGSSACGSSCGGGGDEKPQPKPSACGAGDDK